MSRAGQPHPSAPPAPPGCPLAHQLAGGGRRGWKPQARQHCGAGWRWPPWVGQGAGLELRTLGAAPFSPRVRVLAAPGPRPRGSGLHPVGVRGDLVSPALRDPAVPWGQSRGREARWASRGSSISETLWSNLLPTKQEAQDLEMTHNHTAEKQSHTTAWKERAGPERWREVTVPWSHEAGVRAGRANTSGRPRALLDLPNLGSPLGFQTQQRRCSEPQRVTRLAEGRARTPTRAPSP